MNIKVLCDDTSFRDQFECEHGLSLLITTKNHCILFDTGQSDVFLKNAEKIGADLTQVDIVVLSHGHYDHCNGLYYFLGINPNATIYVHQSAFEVFMHGDKYIGMDPILKERLHIYTVLTERIQIDDEISIYPATELPLGQPQGLTVYNGGVNRLDSFDHELYLVCKEQNKQVLFTGCAHRGIVQIASFANKLGVTHLFGGFHIAENTASEVLSDIVKAIAAYPIQYFAGHCTSSVAIRHAQSISKKQFQTLGAGNQFAVGSHAETACALFRQGYNCSQAVFGAFADTLQLDTETAMKLACSFGGGMGRMREVCGAVSGMLMVCGMMHGYSTPETGSLKADHYAMVQKIASEFRDAAGSIICRELLGGTVSSLPTPTERTAEFYQKRPCERLIYLAASIAEKYFFYEKNTPANKS